MKTPDLQPELLNKHQKLTQYIQTLDSVLIAFSGGVDSSLVLALCHQALGDKAVAVTGLSPSLSTRELENAKSVALSIGAKHILLPTEEMKSRSYRQNGTDRCFHCKTELYDKIQPLAQKLGLKHIANGTNTDDLTDYRPGLISAKNAKILSPLVEADLNKREVRLLAKTHGLPVWEKPASPCLASRIPYGQEVTVDKLTMIEKSEDVLHRLGFKEFRVRHHGDLARIELSTEDLDNLTQLDNKTLMLKEIKNIGFRYVTLDLEGFKSGNLNPTPAKP